MSKVKEGLYYTNTHEWVRVEDGFGFVGITDYAQETLGEIVFIELPDEDTPIEADEEIGAIESVKAASDIISPITGTIVMVNDELVDSPELLNENAFENWIVKIDMEDETELNKLLSAKEYEDICE